MRTFEDITNCASLSTLISSTPSSPFPSFPLRIRLTSAATKQKRTSRFPSTFPPAPRTSPKLPSSHCSLLIQSKHSLFLTLSMSSPSVAKAARAKTVEGRLAGSHWQFTLPPSSPTMVPVKPRKPPCGC